MRSLAIVAATLAITASGAIAQAPPSESDKQFVAKAGVGNTFEIEESKVALERASDPRIKAFAQRMINDHDDAFKKLQDAAGKAGDSKPEAKLDASHQAMLDNLKTFNGTDFDKIYTADQIASHVETVNLLSDYKQNGKTSALMTWTDLSLPIVKTHLADIEAL